MRHVTEAPPVTTDTSDRPAVEERSTAEAPPDDQRFFDEVLHVGLRHTRALLEKRRKKS
jgi:hypothetical protein